MPEPHAELLVHYDPCGDHPVIGVRPILHGARGCSDEVLETVAVRAKREMLAGLDAAFDRMTKAVLAGAARPS